MMNIGGGNGGGQGGHGPPDFRLFFWCSLNHPASSTACTIFLLHTED